MNMELNLRDEYRIERNRAFVFSHSPVTQRRKIVIIIDI